MKNLTDYIETKFDIFASIGAPKIMRTVEKIVVAPYTHGDEQCEATSVLLSCGHLDHAVLPGAAVGDSRACLECACK